MFFALYPSYTVCYVFYIMHDTTHCVIHVFYMSSTIFSQFLRNSKPKLVVVKVNLN